MQLLCFVVVLILALSLADNTCTAQGVPKAVQKEMLVERLLEAKAAAGLTFDQIAGKAKAHMTAHPLVDPLTQCGY